MDQRPAIDVRGLRHRYGRREALRDLTLCIERGEAFAFLGPNGGGKTTLFRVLTTLVPLQEGEVRVLDCDLRGAVGEVRRRIGVVFQAPSLDKKLTVIENVRHQAALYGLGGAELKRRQDEVLEQLGMRDRGDEMVETLSGGLRRRAELAKGLIHRPELLLMDEPSTGLDPGARSDLWRYLERLRSEFGVTVVMTTHLLEEADRAQRIAILNEGQLVALDRPDALRATVGGDAVTIQCQQPAELADEIRQRFQLQPSLLDGRVRLELREGHQWIARLVEAFPGRIQSITLGKPTLEDVFIDKTGHRLS